jgi:hypothetical protein
VTSCDVPFLNLSLIAYLVSQISDCDVAVPYWEDRFQPLHAVYRTSVLPLLKEQLNRGELRPVYLFDKVRTVKIGEDKIRRYDPEGLSFFNMNTPEDYERALKRWNETKENRAKQNPIECTVELFGVAQLLAKTKTISVALPPDATLSHLFFALAKQVPVLVGRVLSPEGGGLVSGCACNVNGLEFIRNPSAKIKAGDKVLILSADAGG